MASVYKRGGRKNRHGKYYAGFIGADVKPVTRCTKCTDYDAAKKIADRWESNAKLIREGVIDAAQAKIAKEAQRPLAEHLADYFKHCRHIGQNPTHVQNKESQVQRLINAAGARRLGDLTLEAVENYLTSLVQPVMGNDGEMTPGLSARSHNQHRATFIAFMAWACRTGRAAVNELERAPKLNENADRRRVRRPLTDDELSRLLAVAGIRRPYYIFAALTGLRVKAVKAATWDDVDFDAGTIRVRVGNAKGKKDDLFLSLHPQVIEELQGIRPHFARPTDAIFRVLPTVRTLRADCTRASIAWQDELGRRIDRHALRTTLGTRLARAGVVPQIAAKVLGLSDVRVTMKHYTILGLSDTAKAMQELPFIHAATEAQIKATGTAGSAVNAQCSGGFQGQSVATSGKIDARAGGLGRNSENAKSLGKVSPLQPLASPGIDKKNDPNNISESRAVGAVG